MRISDNFVRLKDIRGPVGVDLARSSWSNTSGAKRVDRPPFEKATCYADQNLPSLDGCDLQPIAS